MIMLWILGCGVPDVAEECSPLYYENFGAGFITENCQGCHAREAIDREGAPADIYFDDVSDIFMHKDIIVYELQELSMPPAGGIVEEERDAAIEWLSCLEEQ